MEPRYFKGHCANAGMPTEKFLDRFPRNRCNVVRVVVAVSLLWSFYVLCHAQDSTPVAPTKGDGDLGTRVSKLESPDGIIFQIEGGTRAGDNQGNLFHSFRHFSINEGDIALFKNEQLMLPPTNIISRVTGNELSRINGVIKAEGFPDANFFLLNPNGVLFGRHAKLEVQGSFHISTANFLGFNGGFGFFVDPQRESNLSSTSIESFGFLDQSGKIKIESVETGDLALEVLSGKTFSIIGGGIEVGQRTIEAKGGNINIATVDSNSTVFFDQVTGMIISDTAFPFQNATKMTLASTTLDVSQPENSGISTRIGGGIVLIGGKTKITGGEVVSAASQKDGGSINIYAKSLEISDGASLTASTAQEGRGGNININASGLVKITGKKETIFGASPTELRTSTAGQGQAGSIHVVSPSLELSDSAQIGAFTNFEGDAGMITLDVNSLTLSDGAQINSDTSRALDPSGLGGRIVVKGLHGENAIAERIDILGIRNKNNTEKKTGISSTTSGSGLGGSIDLHAQKIVLKDNAEISAKSEGKGENSGESGGIKVFAKDFLALSNESSISVQADNANAGNINIDVGRLLQLSDNSEITASVVGLESAKKGGNINIGQGIKDTINTSVKFERPTEFVVLTKSSSIEGKAANGIGGRISINTDHLFRSTDSIISTESTGNIDGTVEVTSTINNIISGTIQLPHTFLTAFDLSGNPCASLTDRNSSSLIYHGGRSSLPAGPDTLLPASQQELESYSNGHNSGSLRFEKDILFPGVSALGSPGCSDRKDERGLVFQ